MGVSDSFVFSERIGLCISYRPFPRSESRHYYNQSDNQSDNQADIYASLKDIGM